MSGDKWGNVVCTRALDNAAVRRFVRSRGKDSYYRRVGHSCWVRHEHYRRLSREDQCRLEISHVTCKYEPCTIVGKSAAMMVAGFPEPSGGGVAPLEIGKVDARARTVELPTGRNLVIRSLSLRPEHAVFVDFLEGRRVRIPAVGRIAVDLARWHGVEEAVAFADHGIASGQLRRDHLERCAAHLRGVPYSTRVSDLLKLTNGMSESPMESRLKCRLFLAQFPPPHQQVVIKPGPYRPRMRVDFMWKDLGLILEYDGAAKWQGKFGIDPEEARMQELRRQQALNDLGLTTVHVNATSWRDRSWLPTLSVHFQRLRANPILLPNGMVQGGRPAWEV